MSGHLLDRCRMDVASPKYRLWLQAQVLVMPAKFIISLCQTCIPALSEKMALLVTGTVNFCLEYAYFSLKHKKY
jgi:hypothetical protein